MNRPLGRAVVVLLSPAAASPGCFRIIDTDLRMHLPAGEHVVRHLSSAAPR